MKPYNLVNTHKTVHSFSTYNKTYFKKNEFSIPLICIDTFNGCDDGDDKSIETKTEGDFM